MTSPSAQCVPYNTDYILVKDESFDKAGYSERKTAIRLYKSQFSVIV